MCFIRRHIRYSCVYMFCMRHTLSGNSALQHVKLGDGFEIHDGIIFDFYPGLPLCTYLALSSSSATSGSVLVTMTPRFILAGSSAQLEIPINATLSSRFKI